MGWGGLRAMLLDATGTDVLADVVDSLKLRGRIFCRCELSAPWALGFAAGDFLHFHLIGRGNCWLRLHGRADAVALKEGDLLMVTRGRDTSSATSQRHRRYPSAIWYAIPRPGSVVCSGTAAAVGLPT